MPLLGVLQSLDIPHDQIPPPSFDSIAASIAPPRIEKSEDTLTLLNRWTAARNGQRFYLHKSIQQDESAQDGSPVSKSHSDRKDKLVPEDGDEGPLSLPHPAKTMKRLVQDDDDGESTEDEDANSSDKLKENQKVTSMNRDSNVEKEKNEYRKENGNNKAKAKITETTKEHARQPEVRDEIMTKLYASKEDEKADFRKSTLDKMRSPTKQTSDSSASPIENALRIHPTTKTKKRRF